MTSRLERAVREVSDLRCFYLRLQKLRRANGDSSESLALEEAPSAYPVESVRRQVTDEEREM